MNDIFKYIFSAVIAICSFLITTSYNKVNTSIQQLQTEVVSLKVQLVEINARIIDEPKVIEIVRNELLRHGIKD